jgi:hypothetical protein
MRPFLRATDRGPLAPVGWTAETAGHWGGRPVDIVYDPRRHDVLVLRNRIPEHLHARFAEAGFRRIATDGDQQLWVRDRLAVALERLDARSSSPPSRHPSRSFGL